MPPPVAPIAPLGVARLPPTSPSTGPWNQATPAQQPQPGQPPAGRAHREGREERKAKWQCCSVWGLGLGMSPKSSAKRPPPDAPEGERRAGPGTGGPEVAVQPHPTDGHTEAKGRPVRPPRAPQGWALRRPHSRPVEPEAPRDQIPAQPGGPGKTLRPEGARLPRPLVRGPNGSPTLPPTGCSWSSQHRDRPRHRPAIAPPVSGPATRGHAPGARQETGDQQPPGWPYQSLGDTAPQGWPPGLVPRGSPVWPHPAWTHPPFTLEASQQCRSPGVPLSPPIQPPPPAASCPVLTYAPVPAVLRSPLLPAVPAGTRALRGGTLPACRLRPGGQSRHSEGSGMGSGWVTGRVGKCVSGRVGE